MLLLYWTGFSSNVESYSYFSDGVLEITFIEGRTYRYYDVDVDTAKGLGFSRSKGTYINNFIRDRFAFERVN